MPTLTRNGITLRTAYHVVAYDPTFGGFGDDASREFDDEASAVAYARHLRANLTVHGPRYEPISVHKKITMTPITSIVPF